ncbi:type IX secretion system membrane protein PorP/SprF [Polluticoccus soli]|uniref:PorP/SprF family type IX secretion system membrane protein n=1 Tax=Polluticoccus soli TaxID=3034150 RepID=UPI0023E0E7A4|nr:type IX secretion system membrane protein PorP/SprF [Flavipsychrobacter sp. JY13-12]
MKPFRNVWQLAVGVGLIYLLLAMPSGIYAQQNIQFGQYIFNGLAVNPAYAGYKEAWYINGTYRDQWTGFIGAPKTAVVSVDGSFWERNRFGVGFQLINDRLGAQNNTGGAASFAYRIPLDEADSRRLCFGISAGIYNYRIDRNKLNPLDPYDQELEQLKSVTNPDAGLGVYYSTPKLYAGLSALNLISRHENVLTTIKRAPHLYLTSGMLFNVSDRVKLKPSILVKEDFKGPTNMDFNAFILFNDRIWLGGSYRTRVSFWNKDHLQPDLTYLDAWSVIIDFFVTKQLRIGYAYDYTLTEIANYEHGSHEISIGYTFKRKEQIIISPRYF